MQTEKMTQMERQAVIHISIIMSLRMIGLFMVLPVFALYANQLKNATPALMGIALGVYGLSQALLQIPFGMLSDRFGRKPIITQGLLLFIAGSLLASFAHSIWLMIIARALQGAGAIGSTTLALMADLTRENQRTKSMAIAGITIGFSFSIAMVLGPLFMHWLTVSDLFLLAACFGMAAIVLLYSRVPTPELSRFHRDTEPELKSLRKLLFMPELARLNSGIFILHAVFTASFVVIPISLLHEANLPANKQWLLYLPALIGAFIVSMICIGMAERKQRVKPYFIAGITMLMLSLVLLWLAPAHFTLLASAICLFFTGFSLLEAFLPSLVSRTAPAHRKGTALGLYSCAQFSGIFAGGVLGGWLYGKFNFAGVYSFCTALTFFWLLIAFYMQPPRFLVTHILRLFPSQLPAWPAIAEKLHVLPGIAEVTFIAEEGIAYLKMERTTAKHPDFIRIKEQLQSE